MSVHTPIRALLDRLDSHDRPGPEPTDTIFIKELRLDTRIGAYEEERRSAQTLEIDLEIGLCARRACMTDHLGDTVDYAEVVSEIRSLFAENRLHLLEALAEAIAQRVLTQFEARWVSLSIAKAGIVPGASFVGVSITRERQSIGTDRTTAVPEKAAGPVLAQLDPEVR